MSAMRGFSMMESLIALTLFSIVASATLMVLVRNEQAAMEALGRVQTSGIAQAQRVGLPPIAR